MPLRFLIDESVGGVAGGKGLVQQRIQLVQTQTAMPC